MRRKIYISGPITKGDRAYNLYQAHHAQHALLLAGFAPFNPMMTMQLPFAWDGSVSHEAWLESDHPWVLAADAVLRLPGESTGADMECAWAEEAGIPVFYSVEEVVTNVH